MLTDEQTARQRLIATARGTEPADVYITGATVLNVYSGELLAREVAISGERIAYVGSHNAAVKNATTIIDGRGYVLCPGYIEPHTHPFVLYNPATLAEASLRHGVTAIFADNLELFEQTGMDGFLGAAQALAQLPLKYYWLARSHSQSVIENEADLYDPAVISQVIEHDLVKAVGEMTRWPETRAGDATIIRAVQAGIQARRRVEGHAAGAGYDNLNALAAAGIESCHESITAQEVVDRLELGFATMLRYSSLRPDLPDLIEFLAKRGISSARLMLTNDGPSPAFIEEHGLLDGALRVAMERGCGPVEAYRMATLNPALYFAVDRDLGGIAPGRYADINFLADLRDPTPVMTMAKGKVVARDGQLVEKMPDIPWNRWFPSRWLTPGAWEARPLDFVPSADRSLLPTMRLESAAITRLEESMPCDGSRAVPAEAPDASLACLIARDGRRITRAVLRGAMPKLDAIATTFNSAWEILVLGRRTNAMAQAVNRLLTMGGGLVLVHDGRSEFEMELPIGGVMCYENMESLAHQSDALLGVLRSHGYEHHDPLFTLFFLCADFLPEARLTPCGLWNVKERRIVAKPEPLRSPNQPGGH